MPPARTVAAALAPVAAPAALRAVPVRVLLAVTVARAGAGPTAGLIEARGRVAAAGSRHVAGSQHVDGPPDQVQCGRLTHLLTDKAVKL